jgi:hypothetical protein
MPRIALLALLLLGLAAAASAAGPPGPTVRWSFAGCKPTALTMLEPSGKTRWTSPLPAELGSGGWDCRELVPQLAKPHRPDDPYYRGYVYRQPPLIALVEVAGQLALGHAGGVVIYDARSGRQILRHRAKRVPAGQLFDRGRFAVKRAGAELCRGDSRRASLLALCDGKLVFFNGAVAALLQTRPPKLLAEVVADRAHGAAAKFPATALAIPIGPYLLQLGGVTYLR